jgi:hypothetical protein
LECFDEMTCCRFKELFFVAGIIFLAAACESEPTPPPAAPATPDVTQATVPTPDEALRRDAEQYAEDMGVDLEEALSRLQYQDDIGELRAALAYNERDTFAGLWIEHKPEYRIMVQFTQDGALTIRPYIEDKPWADLVEVGSANATLVELESALTKVAPLLRELDFDVTYAANEKENRVEVFVTDAVWFESELQKAGLQLPEHVELVVVEGHSAKEVDVCAPSPVPGVAFPRQTPVEGVRVTMEAELVGELVLLDGCLRVNSIYSEECVVPVWPPEFTLASKNGEIHVLDEAGQIVVRVGEEVYMSGGMGSAEALADCVRQQLPAECRGRHWIVGDEIRPNLRRDSDLFNFDVVTTTERSLFLLHKKPILEEWMESDSPLIGELVLYPPGRCPRVVSGNGHGDYLPLWPSDYAARVTNASVEIVDAEGKVVGRVGEKVQLEGGAIASNWESAEYRRLLSELPRDCLGPYWIVRD